MDERGRVREEVGEVLEKVYRGESSRRVILVRGMVS